MLGELADAVGERWGVDGRAQGGREQVQPAARRVRDREPVLLRELGDQGVEFVERVEPLAAGADGDRHRERRRAGRGVDPHVASRDRDRGAAAGKLVAEHRVVRRLRHRRRVLQVKGVLDAVMPVPVQARRAVGRQQQPPRAVLIHNAVGGGGVGLQERRQRMRLGGQVDLPAHVGDGLDVAGDGAVAEDLQELARRAVAVFDRAQADEQPVKPARGQQRGRSDRQRMLGFGGDAVLQLAGDAAERLQARERGRAGDVGADGGHVDLPSVVVGAVC